MKMNVMEMDDFYMRKLNSELWNLEEMWEESHILITMGGT